MEQDRLDKFQTIKVCAVCGKDIKYSPIRMPIGPPMLNPERPGHYGIQYVNMCCECVIDEIQVLQQKVLKGEMYPSRGWHHDEKTQEFSIVNLSPSFFHSEGEREDVEPESERKVGLFRLIFGTVWRYIY